MKQRPGQDTVISRALGSFEAGGWEIAVCAMKIEQLKLSDLIETRLPHGPSRFTLGVPKQHHPSAAGEKSDTRPRDTRANSFSLCCDFTSAAPSSFSTCN